MERRPPLPFGRVPLARYIATSWPRKLKETFKHANISAGKDGLLIRATAIHLGFLSKVWKHFYIWFVFLSARVSSGNYETMESWKKIAIFSPKAHSHVRILRYRRPVLLMTALRRSHTSDWRQYRQKRGLRRNPDTEASFTFCRARENGGNCHLLHEKEIGFKWPNYCQTT